MGQGLESVLEIVKLSDPGMVRSHNEDSVGADAGAGFAILADGMGGYNAGEVASGMTVAMLTDNLKAALRDDCRDLRALAGDEVQKTNGAVFQAAQSQPQYNGMGTTIVLTVFCDNRVTVAHIGDSRLYRLRGEQFEQITRDHSLLQEQIDSGMISREDARHSHNKNLVTRALGVEAGVAVEVNEYPVEIGDLYLLCSDGLNDMVTDEDIQLTLSLMGANLEMAAQQLVQMANDNGGRDNVSVILVRVVGDFAQKRGWFSRLLSWFGQ
ncbi:MAG: Stp1/IreP family PP2C-type Ser/Thr phosphatase [Sulfuricella sp.]|nr:Stp1/IreP family PP2C-type Ser/Thr phosphatase [Sulfuricella sp.]